VLFGKNNVGKTNILERLYRAFEPSDNRRVRARVVISGHPQYVDISSPSGEVYVELEEGVPFDDEVYSAVGSGAAIAPPRRIAFTEAGLLPGDPWDYPEGAGIPKRLHAVAGPRLHALFLDWDVNDLDSRVEDAVASLLTRKGVPFYREPWPWLEAVELLRRSVVDIHGDRVELERGSELWRVNPAAHRCLDQLASLATDLLPDFIDDPIRARVIEPKHWGYSSKVGLYYGDRPNVIEINLAGYAAARWAAAALQIALHLLSEYPDIAGLDDLGVKGASGHLLLIDEPEAHLHPSAAASVVRWCQRMAQHGFTVVVASHHEEFLRAPADEVTLVHVTRTTDWEGTYGTDARALDVPTTTQLQQLADDVGMHPASALSLHRAILFVEGPLDEAVLDEYGGPDLDAAGVKIIAMHGTKNIEGIVDSEIIAELGLKTGILTDATDPATMNERSGRKRSSEERKVIKVLEKARDKGLPEPAVFGVPEDDLLFALPGDAIRDYLQGPFPGWKELVAECREALGKGPSDSVDWKSHALDHYGLPITTGAGVRAIVRDLDLHNVPLPSVRRVIDEVVNWAR
jgi:AAA domain, putative AbiEii toxin, Type IV TA system